MLRILLLAVIVLLIELGSSCRRRAGTTSADQPIPTSELTLPRHEARLARDRPVIAVLAYNASTEVTDFVVP